MIKLSDYVMKFIAGLGVKHVFMFPGGGAMHLVDSLGQSQSLDYICMLHEQAAAIAMEGYAQYTRNFGVALVTTGPGGTNAITGVTAAWIDSIPCMVISGQVKRPDLQGDSGVRQMGGQEVDIVSIVDSITKYAVTIMDPASIRYHLEKAVYLARDGRPGPVWIDIPLDVQASMIEENVLQGFIEPSRVYESAKIGFQAEQAVHLLKQAQRPVILAGNGIRLAKAEAEFREMIELIGAPVLTTWKGADLLPEEHPLFAGRPGAIGQRGANFTQQNADLIITIGARLDLAQTGYNHAHFAPAGKKVFVDIDPCELAKMQTKIDIPVCCDAKLFIKEMLKQAGLQDIDPLHYQSWREQCAAWKCRYPVVLDQYRQNTDGVNTYVLIDSLASVMSHDDIMVPGSSGACAEITLQAFKVRQGQRIINSPGLGAMGFGLPASIGICLASGGKRVISVIGDGGIQLNIQELETLARLRLPVKIFVLNNRGYGSIRNTQRNYFQGRYVASEASSGLTLPDIIKVGRAYGLDTMRITSQEKLVSQLTEALSGPGPLICEVLIPENEPTAPKLSSQQQADGSMVSKPLEDLWPFLDETELLENTKFMRKSAGKE